MTANTVLNTFSHFADKKKLKSKGDRYIKVSAVAKQRENEKEYESKEIEELNKENILITHPLFAAIKERPCNIKL